ncbi:CehA/McbA family metallohydrolase [Rhodocytophaga rosea]|uniref:CehA/McbA family metallohydrolase n=1 Tax=Rhodocytophaga rosea TaxID=2704465 RepID=UPI001E4E47A7|nr:CehA/McbA family metallohydrolase [Rhodocytophaga rosea]
METLDFLGTPLSSADKQKIEEIIRTRNAFQMTEEIASTLDKYCILEASINPESRVQVVPGKANPQLWQNGWRTFLIKVDNQAGITAVLQASSQQASKVYAVEGDAFNGYPKGKIDPITKQDIGDRWLDMSLYTKPPMQDYLSGLELQYFIVQLYSRDAGKRAASFSVHAGHTTQDLGFRNEADILFDCLPSKTIAFEVKDENGKPTTASFVIKDKQGHIYPPQAKRLAPDFFFQDQIYRQHGEHMLLPEGNYSIEYSRGPEYIPQKKNITVTTQAIQPVTFNLKRWIDPAKMGWYSGDHHIHAAGCAHYTTPTVGVNPSDMMKHILGEGVNVGSVLTWGPGYYHQKQFFEGKDNSLSTADNLMRYDLEVSGFPSGHAGHIVLLRLKDQDYPNTKVLEDWPTWTLPVLKWAKAQGAVTGYAHSGLGLEVKTDKLPNYDMPRFDGIGANEYIVAVTQDLVDFISTVDTPHSHELNIWYHTLNCGYRTRISGETDFPCMSEEQVAHGRSYVKLDGKLNFNDWVNGLKAGRSYVSEGKSHLLNFRVNTLEVGTNGSELHMKGPSTVKVSAKVGAYLAVQNDTTVRKLNLSQDLWYQKPYWNLERARIGNTRTVPVELIVNGEVVATKDILADGNLQDISFDVPVAKSSWVALRILPSSHTNPIFVIVDNKPIRASRQSAEWCVKAVDQCWSQKESQISAKEKPEAQKAYQAAKEAYSKILSEIAE